ncbi:MAG: hypothetical protein JWM80_6520 [Cyanobacteria bacterium RYN_339]|nr:hypothetical protein [Cyanobacteria bacterium RYN_339]
MPKNDLSPHALNRASLARQLLLKRETMPAVTAIQHLVALQAQLARPPYMALWSRLEGFKREELLAAIHAREIVRATFLRGTLFYLTRADYLAFRGTLQPVMDAGLQAILKQRGEMPALAGILELARERFGASPCDFETVRQLLVAHHPGMDDRAMGYAARMSVPLVQVPDESTWGFPGTPAFTTVEAWLGRDPDPGSDLRGLVKRYLAAFGPASPQDMQVWSGLKGLKAVFETMDLIKLGSMYDLPDAPRPDEDTPAPVRFLPDFDTLLSAYDKRQRIIADEHRPFVYQTKNLRVMPVYLVDGMVAGVWKLAGKGTLELTAFAGKVPDEVVAEGERLVRFAEPAAKKHLVVTKPA